jgi:hypothetical protein
MANTNGRGILQFFVKTANQVFTSSAALLSIALGGATGIPIAANQRMKITYWVKFTVGATGGIRLQVAVPAGGAIFDATIRLNNTVAPSSTIATQQATAVFTNALANAGTHWVEVSVYIRNGTTAGHVDLQMAQNTSDALSLTVLEGATADVVII